MGNRLNNRQTTSRGVIVRTNALDQNKTAIGRDLAALLRLWKRVQAAALNGKSSRLLYSDQDLIVQALRDHLDSSIEEVLVDDDAAFQKVQAYVEAFLPRAKIKLERYADRVVKVDDGHVHEDTSEQAA